MKITKLPLSSETVENMKKSSASLYKELSDTYGEENVINNLLVSSIILTEDQDIVKDMSGKKIRITRELINRACAFNNLKYEKFKKSPVNKLKRIFSGGDVSLGSLAGVDYIDTTQSLTPITYNHSEAIKKKMNVEDRKGYIKGGSYKTVEIDGVLHLMCEQIIIDPETKFNYLNGKYCQLSPTALLDTGEIEAVSYINLPAQPTNMSLSSPNLVLADDDTVETLTKKIQEARNNVDSEILTAKINYKESQVDSVISKLLSEGLINGSVKSKTKDLFFSLSNEQINNTVHIMSKLKSSPVNNLPKNLLLKGNMYMDSTIQKTLAFEDFSRENARKYPNTNDMLNAFNTYEATELKVSLSAGEAQIVDPIVDVENTLSALAKNGLLTDSHKKMLATYCNHSSLAAGGGSTPVGDGKPVDGGTEIGTVNNTSLSAPVEVVVDVLPPVSTEGLIKVSEKLVNTLQESYDMVSDKYKDVLEKNKKLEAQLNKIKTDLGA